MSTPSAQLSLPPRDLFKFPPDPAPLALPPPSEYHNLKSPLSVDTAFYNATLSATLPLTIATVYIISAFLLNQVNRYRNYRPYSFSKTNVFFYLVLAHNIGLAAFSAISFVGISRAVSMSWPGLNGEDGLPGAVDGMCRVHGPRGYGDAVHFNMSTQLWEAKNRLIRLAPGGLTPDDTDVGRMWNEGLAFWGWVFYLSKFYEVVDTMIILAKGKRSSTLQTYHHSGAMLCMWAGIRYMSPPIWIWIMLNSAIHTLMYTYYTLSSLKIPISTHIKKSITTLQILQMTVGVSAATMHLFVSYTVPVSVSISAAAAMGSIPSSLSSAAAVATSAIKEAADKSSIYSLAATATAGNLAWLKKLAFRAAGAEGLAENVKNDAGDRFGPEYSAPMNRVDDIKFYRTEYQPVRCIETSGQAFAIWLNIVYLLPLIFLFVRFFYKSYIKAQPGVRGTRRVSRSAIDATNKTSWTVEQAGLKVEQTVGGNLIIDERTEAVSQEIQDTSRDIKRRLENEMSSVNGKSGLKKRGSKPEGEWFGSAKGKNKAGTSKAEGTENANTADILSRPNS